MLDRTALLCANPGFKYAIFEVLTPKTIPLGTRDLKYWYLEPLPKFDTVGLANEVVCRVCQLMQHWRTPVWCGRVYEPSSCRHWQYTADNEAPRVRQEKEKTVAQNGAPHAM